MNFTRLAIIFLSISSLWGGAVYAETQSSDDVALEKISTYLANMKTAKGRFIQVGPDGVISDGDFALKRPNKMFFDYAPPTPVKVISDGFWVAVQDDKLQTTNRYPINETPLKILLAEKPNFQNSEYKIKVIHQQDSLLVDASDPKSPEQGSITLVFTQNPVQLRQWVVTDAQGLKTVVSLQDIKVNAPIENKLFYIENAVKSRYNQ